MACPPSGRHRRSACLAVVLLSLGAAVAAQSPQLPTPGLSVPTRSGPNTGAISGTVTDATTGQPVAGAIVTLAQVRENASEQVPSFPRMVTDSRGRFVFQRSAGERQLLPGRTAVWLQLHPIRLDGAERSADDQGHLADRAARRSMDRQHQHSLVAPRIDLRTSSRRTQRAAGWGCGPRILPPRPLQGNLNSWRARIVTTDNRGMYRLSALEPNRYIVSVLSVLVDQSSASTPEGAQRGALGELLTGESALARSRLSGRLASTSMGGIVWS